MAGGQMDMGAVMSEQLMAVAQVMEEQLDAEISKLDRLEEDDLEQLRRTRVENLKKAQAKKREWLSQGHGEYSEIPEEKEFFDVTRKSENVVVHFYRDETFRCRIFDKHLAILAKKHLETKFAKINAEKCPFLTERLRIKVIPTLILVKDSKTRDYVVGFTDLGNTDEFSTELLEWRLAKADIINYSGDLTNPPDSKESKSKTTIIGKKITKGIRNSATHGGESSDDDDW